MLHPETRIMSHALFPLCAASVVVTGRAVGEAVEAEKKSCFLVDSFQIGWNGVVGDGTGADVVDELVTWDATLGVTWKQESPVSRQKGDWA